MLGRALGTLRVGARRAETGQEKEVKRKGGGESEAVGALHATLGPLWCFAGRVMAAPCRAPMGARLLGAVLGWPQARCIQILALQCCVWLTARGLGVPSLARSSGARQGAGLSLTRPQPCPVPWLGPREPHFGDGEVRAALRHHVSGRKQGGKFSELPAPNQT